MANYAMMIDFGSTYTKLTAVDLDAAKLLGTAQAYTTVASDVRIGFQKALEISGVGYRAELAGSTLKLALGFSAPVEYSIPKGVTVAVDKQVNLVVSGINKELVGRVAAEIRALKKPEPYKGKGIKYVGERVRRKAGKAAGAK